MLEEVVMLNEFIASHRQELLERTRSKVALRAAPEASIDKLENGVPLFLTQLGHVLAREAADSAPDGSEMGMGATALGSELLAKGYTIGQVVHNYGDICQAITELAVERGIRITTEEFHTLNRCLDEAIANAVTEYARQSRVDASDANVRRQGVFAHELRNYLNTAMLTFEVLKTGRVGLNGSTVEVLGRSLHGLRELVDRSLSEIRLATEQPRVPLRLVDLIGEMELDARVNAADRGLQVQVEQADVDLVVLVDRHLFASEISNLLQNAFKFTRAHGRVWLRTRPEGNEVAIEIEDECGGLPPGAEEAAFRPFEQLGSTRGGLGLGLTIARQAIEANGGRISLHDRPGKGCVFVAVLPLAEGVAVPV
jgi:signal transduction histidine kinase